MWGYNNTTNLERRDDICTAERSIQNMEGLLKKRKENLVYPLVNRTELGIQFDQAAAEKLNLSFILSYRGEEKGNNSNFYQISGRQCVLENFRAMMTLVT